MGEKNRPAPRIGDPGEQPCPHCGGRGGETVTVSRPHLSSSREESFRWVRCGGCRLVHLANRPGPEEMERYYGPEYVPHRGPEAWGRWAPLVRRAEAARDRTRLRWCLEALDTRLRAHRGPGPLRVLDVGCGRPTFLRTLRDETGWTAVGVDTTDAGWRDAKSSDASRWRDLDLRAGRISELRLDPDSFHVITLWHVLEHVDDPGALLERLGRWAAPGAALVVEVPDHASLPRRLQGPSWIGYDTPRHRVAFEPEPLRRILEATGWRVRELRRRGTLDPWTLWWLGRQVARGRTLAGSLEGAFLPFLAGKVLTAPLAALQRWLPLGAMTAFGRRSGGR